MKLDHFKNEARKKSVKEVTLQFSNIFRIRQHAFSLHMHLKTYSQVRAFNSYYILQILFRVYLHVHLGNRGKYCNQRVLGAWINDIFTYGMHCYFVTNLFIARAIF